MYLIRIRIIDENRKMLCRGEVMSNHEACHCVGIDNGEAHEIEYYIPSFDAVVYAGCDRVKVGKGDTVTIKPPEAGYIKAEPKEPRFEKQ